jgi:hypothetical protein
MIQPLYEALEGVRAIFGKRNVAGHGLLEARVESLSKNADVEQRSFLCTENFFFSGPT